MNEPESIRCWNCGYELQPVMPCQICPECGLENDDTAAGRRPLRPAPHTPWWLFALRIAWPAATFMLLVVIALVTLGEFAGFLLVFGVLAFPVYPFVAAESWVSARYPQSERTRELLRWSILAYASTAFGVIACSVVIGFVAGLLRLV
ncbi:MAG: hypothetical protein ACKVU4_14255 [Phycisphaerales bacterium]